MATSHRQSGIICPIWAVWGICCLVLIGCNSDQSTIMQDVAKQTEAADSETNDNQDQDDKVEPKEQSPESTEWAGEAQSLISRDSLEGWEAIEYGGEGDCRVENGVLVIESGDPMSGIHSTRDDLPKTNYEISLQARRVEGIDMFCGLTFPVGDSHCTLVVGGWAGSTVGLSCIDDLDASSNDTSRIMLLKSDQWHRIRVRVVPEKITAWIDDEVVVSQSLNGHKISLRTETVPCRPFGLCTFQTTAETKDLKVRRIKPATSNAK